MLIIQELVSTEVDYISSLQYVVDNYIPEMNHGSLPQPLRGKKNIVFANVEKICEFHSQCFIRLLRQCLNNPFQLGACFLQHVRDYFRWNCSVNCSLLLSLKLAIAVHLCMRKRRRHIRLTQSYHRRVHKRGLQRSRPSHKFGSGICRGPSPCQNPRVPCWNKCCICIFVSCGG